MTDRHTTYARAAAAYDRAFEEFLASEIFNAIVEASRCTDTNAIALRTGEMAAALLKMLALTLALSPCARSPTALRTEVDELAKRLGCLTREAIDNQDFQAVGKRIFHGDDVGGHA